MTSRAAACSTFARLLTLALVMSVSAGCRREQEAQGSGTRPPNTGGGRSAGMSTRDADVSPSDPIAETYGVERALEPNAAEAELLRGLGGVKMTHSPSLSRMTRALAASTPDRANVPPALVEGLLSWYGIVEPPPSLVVVDVDGHDCTRVVDDTCLAPMEALLDEAKRTLQPGSDTLVGVGAAKVNSGTRLMVSYVTRGVELEPVAASHAPGTVIPLEGRLLGGRTAPRVEVTDAQGLGHRLDVESRGDRFSAVARCAFGRGTYRIEVLATGKHGPEVVANFPVHCGVRPPASVEYEIETMSADVDAEVVARANFELLNRARGQRGLPALQWDERAAAIARAHSADMARNGFVGHTSPTTGDVVQRFAKVGVKGTVIRENVARGYGPRGIHDSLMNSPGHRVNILAEDVTHVGIGVIVTAPETDASSAARPVFLTQNFFRVAGGDLPSDLVGWVRGQVTGKRKNARLSPLTFDAGLDAIAQRLAESAARSGAVAAGYEEEVFQLGFESVERHQIQAGDHLSLPGLDLWRDSTRGVSHGVGVSVVRDGNGAYVGVVMVVLVAER